MYSKERPVTIEEVRSHLMSAQEKLSAEKDAIVNLHPLTSAFNRETYAFAYVRAERLGMQAINTRLSGLSWLPMQLDTSSEMLDVNRNGMKRWLKSSVASAPEAIVFGNDFMHALTRCALRFGWNTPEFFKLAARISVLFRDLSCLIGVAWYCNWFAQNNVEKVTLSEPDNLSQTAAEFAAFLNSPELLKEMRAPEQNNEEKKTGRKNSKISAPAKDVVRTRPLRRKPVLRVIDNDGFTGNTLPLNS